MQMQHVMHKSAPESVRGPHVKNNNAAELLQTRMVWMNVIL